MIVHLTDRCEEELRRNIPSDVTSIEFRAGWYVCNSERPGWSYVRLNVDQGGKDDVLTVFVRFSDVVRGLKP
jgi:hypothetical protein